MAPRDPVSRLGEDGLLALLGPLLARHTAGLPLGTGDDVAMTDAGAYPGRLVWTIDAMVEGTHFRFWPRATPADIGYKLAGTNLSDLASKGAQPRIALIALGLPGDAHSESVAAFYAGLDEALAPAGARLVGGDTVRAPQWTATLALVGELAADATIAARSNARPGDTIAVSGTLGDALAGFRILEAGGPRNDVESYLVRRHLRPTPRLDLGARLVASATRLAMLDLSDGLARDARRIAEASGVRLVLDREALPLSPQLVEWAAAHGHDPRAIALQGGEDYELLVAAEEELAPGLTVIGRVEAGAGAFVRNADGGVVPLTADGFEHFA